MDRSLVLLGFVNGKWFSKFCSKLSPHSPQCQGLPAEGAYQSYSRQIKSANRCLALYGELYPSHLRLDRCQRTNHRYWWRWPLLLPRNCTDHPQDWLCQWRCQIHCRQRLHFVHPSCLQRHPQVQSLWRHLIDRQPQSRRPRQRLWNQVQRFQRWSRPRECDQQDL